MKALSMNRSKLMMAILAVLFLLAGCKGADSKPAEPEFVLPVTKIPSEPDGLPVLKNPQPDGSFDHDTKAFTQGLLFLDGKLYESTGRRGHSKIRRLDAQTGKVELETPMDPDFFGEGLAYFQDHFYQLTYQAGVCAVYDKELKPQGQLLYGTEGWGLTVDPEKQLFLFTDGSDQLRFLSPENLTTKHKLTVTDGNGKPVARLNELEWVNGEVWANIWTSDTIARIDPETGKVVGWIHLPELVKKHHIGHEEVLNGIAYDAESDRLWITGKLWPKIYWYDGVKEKFFSSDS
jgi:glutamine cyclotransferase